MSSRTTGKSPEHTMLIKAPTFSKSGRAWRPFVFNNLCIGLSLKPRPA